MKTTKLNPIGWDQKIWDYRRLIKNEYIKESKNPDNKYKLDRYILKDTKKTYQIYVDKVLHNSGKPRDHYYRVYFFDGQCHFNITHKRELIPALEEGILSYNANVKEVK